MGLQKVALNLIVKQRGKFAKRILHTNPQKAAKSISSLKLQPLATDTVQFAKKETEQITKKAEELLGKIRELGDIDYIEERCPDIVQNVARGHVTNHSELEYQYYKYLEILSKENPEKFVLLGSKGSAFNLHCMPSKLGDIPIQLVKDTPVSELKQIFKEIDDFAQKNEFEPDFFHYIQMLIIKKHNPKTYEYLMKTKDPWIRGYIDAWGNSYKFSEMPSVSFFQNITPEQLKVMHNDCFPITMKNISAYVECSDDFILNKKAVQELSEDLSKCKLSSDVQLFRGEKTVGMFNSVSVDDNFEKQLRQLLEANKDKAKHMNISTYNGSYMSWTSTSLYDYLSAKETLTLADAMQLAKFGDEKFVNEIITRLKTSKIIDKRFKSLSFDKGMADFWRAHNAGNNTTIIQNATVKQGTQGGYHAGLNAQYEVVLNNTPKEMTFPEVVYHKDGDYFELDSIIKNI